MNKPTVRAGLAAVSAAAAIAMLVSGCTAAPAPTGSPFQSGSGSTHTSPGSALPVSSGDQIDSGTATATVTVTSSADSTQDSTESSNTLSGPAPTGGNSITEPPTTSTTSSAALNYSTTLTAPPTPIGAAGTQTSSTETMETVTPTAMAKAPYPGITAPTLIRRPAETGRTDPVQLAAAFVSLMEAPASTDSRADNATLRATPFTTDALRTQLTAAQDAGTAEPAPTVGYEQVTVRSAVVTNAVGAGPAAKTVTVAVLYDRLAIISASQNYNQEKLLLRLVTLQKGADGTWLVSGYRHGAN